MKSNRQTTLFQSWGNQKKEAEKCSAVQETAVKASTSTTNSPIINLCDSFDDDDDILLYQAEETINFDANNGKFDNEEDPDERHRHAGQEAVDEIHKEDHECNISIGAENFTLTPKQTQCTGLPGFDMCAGKLWIYPTNYPVRDYQYNIVQQALFKNTMVTLPTGLGKTFIAAVIMYNFYRWYPQGKVVFMAPTKPLVAQQIEACYNIMGIPQDHTAEMTGSMGPPKREKAWHEKRVFFLTPQVLTNDLSRGSCPAEDVKCLVIDEAHKALGNHAYCQVVRELIKYTENFRVLALSATPGSDIKAVQQVLTNLLISHIEIRTEESIDIKQYSHERKVDKIVVPLGEELTKVKEKYIHIMDVVVSRLKRQGVLYNRDTTSLSKFLILKSREAFRQNPPERLPRSQFGVVEGDFALAMSLYHGYELLQLHGSRSLFNFLVGILTGDKGYGRTKAELTRNGDFNELMGMLSGKYSVTANEADSSTQTAKPFVIGHPKMEKLQTIVLEHFDRFSHQGPSATRVMIFSQYRDSVKEITDMLDVHKPLVKAMCFIGQSSVGKASKGFTQKEQLKVMKQFREGGYNTLVSTCVGEEGLDIGDVDLIICFDAHKSPIRLVQRMGRTGRKREGRIVMLVTQGKEEQIYNQSQYSKKSIHKTILNGARSLHFYQHSPRMVPERLSPKPHKMHITVKDAFKPTKRISTDNKTDQSKIKSLFDNAGKKDNKEEEILSLEQFQELQDWCVDDVDVPKLPEPEIVCLTKGDNTEVEDELPGPHLSLSEWSLWQNTLQHYEKVGHSEGSKHLVQLMEFVQLQHSLDPDDDPYGLEMASYLNEEDLLKPGELENNPTSILRYCVSKKAKKSDEGMRGKEKNLPKSRKSDALPNFDDDDNKDSDDDLPAFTLSPKEPFEYEKDRARLDNLAEDEDIEDRGENFGKATSSLTSDVLSHDNTSDVGDEVASNYIVKKRVIGSRAKSLEKKMNESVIRKAKKRKRGRHTSDCRTVVELIADNDPNDFDGECNDPDDGKLNVRSLARTEKSQIEEPNISNSNHMDLADVLTDVSNETTDETNNYKLCSPPPLEDVVPLVNSLDDTDLGERIDLIKLVDEWEKENCVRQFIVKCNTMSFTDSHSFSGCGPNPGVCSSFKENDLGQMEDYTNRNSVRDSGKLKTFSKSDSPLKLETEASKMEKLVRSESPKNSPLKNNSINNSISKLDGEQYDEIGLYKSLDSSGIHIKETILPLKDKISNKSKGHVKNLEASFVPSNVLEAVDITSTSSASPTRARVPSSETRSTFSGKIPFTEINHKDDSWLADEMDQELADSLKTQRTSLKSLKGLETSTQVTFTQALAYVHSSVGSECDSIDGAQLFQNLKDVKHLENSQIDKKSSQSSTSNLEGRTPSIGDKENAVEQPQSISEEVRSQGFLTRGLSHVISPQKIVQPQNTSECSRNSYDSDVSNDSMEKSPSSKDAIKLPGSFMASFDLGDLSDSDGIDAPQFDLGFDIDEDIIPPSPNATQQSQKSVTNCISQSFSNSLKIGQTRHSLGFNNPNQEKVLCINMQSGSSKDKQVASVPMKVKKSLTLTLDKKGNNDKTGNISSERTQKERTGTKIVCGLKSVQEYDMSDEEIVIKANKRNPMQESRFNLKESDGEKIPKYESNTVKQTLILTQEELQQSLSPVAEASFCLMDNDDLGTWFDSEPEEMEKLQDFENAAQICILSEDKCYDNKEMVRDKSKQSPDEINVNKLTNKNRIKSSGDPGKETNNGSSYNMVKAKLNKGKIPKDITTPINKFKNRKSVFDVNDFSPDPFNDSFDFASAEFTKISPAPLKTNRKPTSLSSSTPMQTHQKGHIIKDSLVKSPVSEHTLQKSENSSESDSDDSFVVRKKKKAFIIESPCSQVFKDKENIECNNQSLLKTNYQDKTLIGMKTSSDKAKNAGNQQSHRYNALGKGKKLSVCFVGSDDEDFGDTELLKKQNYLLPKSRFRSGKNEFSSDEDFDKPPNPNALRKAKTLSSFGRSGCNKVRRSKNAAGHIPFKHEIENTSPPCKARKKRSSNPFVEEEAELSEDGADEASSDENEEVLDHYEASFIQDSEQLSQSQSLDHTEMQAIYMKSIKSPSAGAARYKLQYDYKNVDVFSQIPEEESQYMEDSFCVGEEDDDWLGGLEEKLEPMEVTIMSPGISLLKSGRTRRKKGGGKVFETGRERALHQGRMKALDKIKLKMAAKNQAAPKRRLTDDENRKFPKKNRIQVLEDSSPEGKGNKAGNDSSDLTSPEVIKVKKKTKHAILSSSDEEENENKLAKVKPQDRENDQPYDDVGRLTKLKDNTSIASNNQTSSHQSDADLLICGTKKSKVNSKAVILVDSKEISGSQDIISDLRFKHGIQVSAAQLPGCDYIISNRMAVERKQWSEFSNGANRAKLSERIQSLSDLYDRPVLIIEKDRVKPGEEKFVKPLHWTKYVDKTIALLTRSEIKVLYTDSQKETAALLADLCQLEKRKGMGITARVDLNTDQQNKVKFFATIPKLSYIHALNLSSGFKSVLEFMSSSIHMIQTKGQMSENRAICVYKFLRRQFDSSML